jgi:hypothetical protein
MGDVIKLDVRSPATNERGVFVSVIIPLSLEEAEPGELIAGLPCAFEIILARGGTRAASMNAAARVACGRHLWFLHADTMLHRRAVETLLAQLATEPEALRYFDLRFDGGRLMRVTEIGVRFRSRVLAIPFGDQAFCIPSERFIALGGYDEATATGEDHFLVRQAHHAGLPVLPVGISVVTSARKYLTNGWLKTTLNHLRFTFIQTLLYARRGIDKRKPLHRHSTGEASSRDRQP